MLDFSQFYYSYHSLLFMSSHKPFSLAGPQPPWMQEASPSSADYYNLPLLLNYSGPMMIDEEYRFNTPVVTYGFTSDFVSFFGARGMDEGAQHKSSTICYQSIKST